MDPLAMAVAASRGKWGMPDTIRSSGCYARPWFYGFSSAIRLVAIVPVAIVPVVIVPVVMGLWMAAAPARADQPPKEFFHSGFRFPRHLLYFADDPPAIPAVLIRICCP